FASVADRTSIVLTASSPAAAALIASYCRRGPGLPEVISMTTAACVTFGAICFRAPRKIGTSANLCESEEWQQDSGCGWDGAIRIFGCGQAAWGDDREGRSAGNDCSRGAVRELPRGDRGGGVDAGEREEEYRRPQADRRHGDVSDAGAAVALQSVGRTG